MTLRLAALAFGLAFLLPAGAHAGGVETQPIARLTRASLGGLTWSPDGKHIAMSNDGAGVHVLDRASGEMVTLTEDESAGYRVRWSPDGRRLAFKLFVPVSGRELPLQIPVVYDLPTGSYTRLSAPAERAGVPAFASDGRLAFTVEDAVVVLSADGAPLARWSLGEYVNLVSLSPDGSFLAFAAESGLAVLDLASGQRVQVSKDGSLFDPQWSADGRRLLVSEASGGLEVFDLEAGRVHQLPRAASARWMPDGESVLFESNPIPDADGSPVEAGVFTVRYDGTRLAPLVERPGARETSPALSPDGKWLAWRSGGRSVRPSEDDGGQLVIAPLAGRSVGLARALEVRAWRQVDDGPAKAAGSVRALRSLTTKEITGVPYLHQVYDTPDNFNGQWACGPTSAMMTIAFRGILPNWDCTCSSPSSHVSHWGRYISQIYTKGRTFNISAATASGVGYGAYGYIRNPSGFDTKGHMAEFLRYHGLTSSVDWSPTWAELQAEVAAKQPFVILTTITSAGHYKVVIGYVTTGHTMLLNDPYGDKARGYMNNYGKRVFYDWPGYSNGFPNVNSVACFVYSRYTPPQPTTGTLKGTVYKAPTTTAYLSGATVTAGGKTATTNASGAFSFTLAAGTYSVVVKATGYQNVTVSKAVTAGGTASVAVGLYPTVVTGDLVGVVYEANPANPADRSKPLPAAQVSLDGGAFKAVRATDAYFAFTTTAGPHTVKAKLAGYTDNSSTGTVVAGKQVSAPVGLSKTATQVAPKLHLESPEDGAWLDDTSVDVTGSVENADGVAEVQVKAGTQTFTGPVTGGTFAVPVTVAVGATVLEVKAVNSAGSDTQTLTVNFKTGVCGIVSDSAGPLSGAAVALLSTEDACAAPLSTTTAGADGRFCLDAAEGSYLLRASPDGYVTYLYSVEVTATERQTVEITVLAGADPVPTITLVGPEIGDDGKAHVSEPTVSLSWRTSGISSVETKVNGEVVVPTGGEDPREGDTLQVVAGLPLQDGENRFEIQITGQCGTSASATVVVVHETVVAVPDGGVPQADAGKAHLPVVTGGFSCGVTGAAAPLLALLALAALARRRRAVNGPGYVGKVP